MQLVDHARAFLDQVGALAGQVAQGALRRIWHETGPQQPMRQQLGNPLGIANVGLASRHLLDMLRVDHQHGETALQQVVDRFPELTGALHGHVGNAEREQPVDKRQQPGRGGRKGADVGRAGAVGLHNPATDHDRLLVNQ